MNVCDYMGNAYLVAGLLDSIIGEFEIENPTETEFMVEFEINQGRRDSALIIGSIPNIFVRLSIADVTAVTQQDEHYFVYLIVDSNHYDDLIWIPAVFHR